jgi:hypothetical protein
LVLGVGVKGRGTDGLLTDLLGHQLQHSLHGPTPATDHTGHFHLSLGQMEDGSQLQAASQQRHCLTDAPSPL